MYASFFKRLSLWMAPLRVLYPAASLPLVVGVGGRVVVFDDKLPPTCLFAQHTQSTPSRASKQPTPSVMC